MGMEVHSVDIPVCHNVTGILIFGRFLHDIFSQIFRITLLAKLVDIKIKCHVRTVQISHHSIPDLIFCPFSFRIAVRDLDRIDRSSKLQYSHIHVQRIYQGCGRRDKLQLVFRNT